MDAVQNDPKLAKFKKMLSMGVPEPAVRQKMMMAQVSPATVDLFFNKATTAAAGSPKKPKSNLMKLHWDKMEEVPDDSVWANVQGQFASDDSKKNDNIAKLKKLFTKQTAKSRKASGKTNAAKKKKSSQILDGKRAHNIEIGLAQYRAFSSFADIVRAVCHMDRRLLNVSKVATLIDIAPTEAEKKQALRNTGGNGELSKASKWVLEAIKQDRFASKCETFLFILQFGDNFSQLSKRISLISNACRAVMGSESLKTVLGNVLDIGNAMNQGTHAGGARGFKLDSLLKLTQTKSQDKKTTVLDFLVESEAEHNLQNSESPPSDGPTVITGVWVEELKGMSEVARLSRAELNTEFLQLQHGMTKIRNLGNRSVGAVPEQAAPGAEDDECALNEAAFRKACKQFSEKEERRIRMCRSVLEEMGKLCEELALYFGEDSKRYDVTKAFETLGQFSKLYERSLNKLVEKRERQERMAQRAANPSNFFRRRSSKKS